MGELIDFLIVIVVILYIVKVLYRGVMSLFVHNVADDSRSQQNYKSTSSKPGSIRIDHMPQQQKGKIPDSEGDFVDYEEIK